MSGSLPSAAAASAAASGEFAVLEPPAPLLPEPGRTFLPWRRLAHPVDWAAAFGRVAPLHLEVGFGDGRFTAAEALARPDDDFVGLEVSGTSLLRGLRRMRSQDIGNVRLLKAPAEVAVRQLFARGSLSSIVVNFPDPWPKERHERHRLLRSDFFRLAADRLQRGGELRLASDHLPYVAFAREQALASGVAELLERPAPEAVFQTKYALKWREQGKPLYYQVFVLDGGGDQAPQPALGRPDQMPHALLRGALPQVARFEKIVHRAKDGGHVVVHEAAKVLGEDGRWWFRVTVDEGELVQQLLLVAQRRDDDEVIVRLEGFGDPLITATVREAVGAVSDWLAAQPGLQLSARNY